MLSRLFSCGLTGLEGRIITVEADVNNGLPQFLIVGLPDVGIRESKERIRSAVKNSGFRYPAARTTVNLAPADFRKEGSSLDLPIALSILCASEQLYPHPRARETIIIGELSLSGDIKPVHGVLPVVMAAREAGFKAVVVPKQNVEEAALASGIDVYAVASLSEAADYLRHPEWFSPERRPIQCLQTGADKTGGLEDGSGVDFADIRGQYHAKRALEIAAAGGHNILLSGPPGSGKSMLVKALPSILPELTPEEMLDITRIYSVAGKLGGRSLIARRPFRAPHHTVSASAMAGGGAVPKPGEVSLAHLGVLYLDELPEFSREASEILRQPLEDSQITVTRVQASVTYPASFMLAASMNPCPCGWQGTEGHGCHCTPVQVANYRSRISGPLLDRIDLFVNVPQVTYGEITGKAEAESSAAVAGRVNNAREIQNRRYSSLPGIYCNADLGVSQIDRYCPLGEDESELMEKSYTRFGLTARGYHRILKLARTIADLAGEEQISCQHIGEAIQYRTDDSFLHGGI